MQGVNKCHCVLQLIAVTVRVCGQCWLIDALSSAGRWQKWLCGGRPSGSGSGYEWLYWISSLCEEGMTDWFWNKTYRMLSLEPWLFLILSFAAAQQQRGPVRWGLCHQSSFGGSQPGDEEGGHAVANRVSSRLPVSAYIHIIHKFSETHIYLSFLHILCSIFNPYQQDPPFWWTRTIWSLKHNTGDGESRHRRSQFILVLLSHNTKVAPQSRFIHFTQSSSVLPRFLCTSKSIKICHWSAWTTGRRSQPMCVL